MKKIFLISLLLLFSFLLLNVQKTDAVSLPDQLFTPDSPWNQPIGTNVKLDPNSSAMVAAVDSRVNPTDNDFGMPLYISSTNDPTCTVKVTGGGDEPFQSDQPVHIPNSATPSKGDDHWLFIYDTTKNLIFEMWDTTKSGNCFSTDTGDVYSPTGDGVLQPNGERQDGNGGSYFGGVVNSNDAKRGYINHALSLASQATKKNAGRYPMNQQTDGGNGPVPMGARFQLDPSFHCDDMSGASKGEIMVCHAMQTYGGYMHDTGGVPMSIYFQEDTSAQGAMSALGIHESQPFTHIPWNKMRVLAAWNSYTPLPQSSSSSVSSTANSSSSTGTSSSTSPITGNASISLALQLIGLGVHGGNQHPLHTTRNIQLFFYTPDQDPTNVNAQPIIVTNTVHLDTTEGSPTYGYFINKNISIGPLSGPYQIFVKTNQFLRTQIVTTSNDNTFSFTGNKVLILPQTSLLPGDIYPPSSGLTCLKPTCIPGKLCSQIILCGTQKYFGDTMLDISDYNLLISCFERKGNATRCPNAQAADLNDDGRVDGVDYNLMLRSFNQLSNLTM